MILQQTPAQYDSGVPQRTYLPRFGVVAKLPSAEIAASHLTFKSFSAVLSIYNSSSPPKQHTAEHSTNAIAQLGRSFPSRHIFLSL